MKATEWAGRIAETVKKYVADRILPLEQRVATLEARAPERGEKGDPGDPGRDGVDGKDGAQGERGADGVHGENGRPGIDGKDGKDGIDGKSITIEDVHPIMESMHAKWELDFERRAQDMFQRTLDRMPKPKDGENGQDGIGFDDLSFEQIDERSAILRFTRGSVVKEFPIALAGFVDKGVWKEGEYVKGDGVTWDGSYWLARCTTTAKPGSEGEDAGNNAWRLAVRKGRKGKDGAPGRDLRSVTAKLPA